ncbi:hypothetical protein C8F04DRAFT_365559 [Mycena alexandri]|uniref:Uncharacterized protein n=1 Tax=Mycena alexandri TaxID=1745969 RepID=A0AAD6S4A2_9AGAR|nr:hypothetical protein C8F04DRAFT_365559 [Mycena alexandri]
MKLPQELVDLIIGEIFVHKDPDPFLAWRQRSPVARYTLKSCTLLSRAFLRTAQKQLFLAIRIRSGVSDAERLAQLLNTPHLCRYVKDLEVEYGGDGLFWACQFSSLLPNLQAISLHSLREWVEQPDSVRAILTLPTLRCVQLTGYRLRDAVELHTILKNAVGLKQLALTSIAFRNEVIDVRIRPPASIVLDSLRLTDSGLRPANISAMLEAFTTVDISRLRRLEISRSAGEDLLRTNASTLEEVEIDWEAHHMAPYEDAPIGAHHLRSITVTAPKPSNVASALRFLGNLADMADLEKVKLTVVNKLDNKDEAIWRLMDTSLSSAPHLRVVEVVVARAPGISDNVLRALDTSGWMSPPAERDVPFPEYFDDGALMPSRWLPALAEKQILRISH